MCVGVRCAGRPGTKSHIFLSCAPCLLILAPPSSPQLSSWPAWQVWILLEAPVPVGPLSSVEHPKVCWVGCSRNSVVPEGLWGVTGTCGRIHRRWHLRNFTAGEGGGTLSLSGKLGQLK